MALRLHVEYLGGRGGPPADTESATNQKHASPPKGGEPPAGGGEALDAKHKALLKRLGMCPSRRKQGDPDFTPSAPAKREASVGLWLVDTGCGHNLISRQDVKFLKRFVRRAAHPITFITANGKTTANSTLRKMDSRKWTYHLLYFFKF